MLYASVSRGFKGGGFTGQNSTQATIERTFNPEFAWNYEAGIRSRFLDNRAQVNATLYQMDYSDLQGTDRKSTRLNSSHYCASRMPSSALQNKTTNLPNYT